MGSYPQIISKRTLNSKRRKTPLWMTQSSSKFCEYHYCDGDHHKNSTTSEVSRSTRYLKMALNNYTNKRIMEEKLQRCQETLQIYKKNSLDKKLMYLPAFSEMGEDS